MNGNPPATLKDTREKQTSYLEVVNAEKLLWATIQYKGISHAEVQDLYRKVRSGYEKIILNDYQAVDLQEVEYSLWKLHYKHIDEYRKKIKKVSASAESTNLNSQVEGFKLFLSEVAEFYKDLIAKFRRKTGGSISVEPATLQKCHYACHRFLVCLGDLSRYMELCKKPDVQKWAVAATYYLEATTVWPQSGNPQNQLALLATYIGDDFLALYHCIRSLAVNEPFPDALDNIMLLFEKNKSSQLQSLSTDAHIDFSKPLKRLSSQIKSHPSMDSTNINKLGANDHVLPAKTDLWPLFVRMISFFLVKPSFEDLPHTFASTMKELEALLALNDAELNSSLEPYEQFDSSRKGPYRALQAVAILIFRCLTSNDQVNCCSLLPAVLVFVEWYVGILDFAETYGKDEKVLNAKSYFFGALVDLLSGFDVKDRSLDSANKTALWEDYELMGFGPVSQLNDSLDFGNNTENRRKFEAGNSVRIHRILHASMKIAERLKGSSQSPIFYNQSARKFYAGRDPEKISKKNEREVLEAMEEEEVILFKPLTRYNSEPIQTSSNDEPVDHQTETSEEGLRRSASLFAAQNGSQDSSKKSPPYSAGPPSLSGWVVNRESVNLEREKGPKSPDKKELAPISELAEATTNVKPYVAPVPSAPRCYLNIQFGSEEVRQKRLHRHSGVAGFVDAYRPPVFGLSSSEWLYRYTHNLSLEPGNGNLPNANHPWPVLPNNPSGKFHGYDGGSRFDVIDRWGNPLLTNRMVYFENPNLVYGGAGGGELRAEQPPLLQHLKDREWQLQTESPFRGNPYMGK
ncbi:hypothetical protein OSB04_un001517 [Centaurea solstitialis]|uniref:Protein SMG7L n=1 Tax=Centaurea solstitialis TaxID=347529 RepID=A0AA38W1M9_9ASTR|nr:hypothetical protein OSB04_un001517 [Centaurea solstitialis]